MSAHHHHGHEHNHYEGNKKGLFIALFFTFAIMLVELIGGLIAHSLALLSDSGHMLSDVVALCINLVVLWLANRSDEDDDTYIETGAGLFNGISLFVIASWIVYEAIGRILHPVNVQSGYMMLIGLIGLAFNALSAWSLMRHADVKENLNVRGAFLHIISDAMGALGALVAGIIIYFTHWNLADPILSILMTVMILRSAYHLVADSIHILREHKKGH